TTFGVTLDSDVHDRAIKLGKAQAAAGERLRSQFLAQSRGQLVARWNQHFVKDARVVRKNDVSMRAIAEEANERGMLALDNLQYAAFGAAVRAAALDTA